MALESELNTSEAIIKELKNKVITLELELV